MSPDWERLDRRSPAVTALLVAGVAVSAAVPISVGMRDDGRPLWTVVVGVLLVVGLAGLGDRLRWRYTRYRITEDRVELRFSLVVHRLRSVPRDRIRTVDLTANPLLRMFGVVKVHIGTGQQSGEGSHLVLNSLDRKLAERLRAELLARTAVPAAPTDVGAAAPIAELNWSWIRYAPLSLSTPVLGTAAFGALLQVSEWFGLQETVLGEAGELLRGLPLPVLILVLVGAGIAVGVLGSLGLFVELWFRYRLTREQGTFRVRRGLLTTRSFSLDEARLRGVEVVEPLGARLLGAAKVDAVASGLRTRGREERSDPRTLLPPAPLPVAHRVAAEIVGEPVSPTVSARLRPHPPAARRRRLVWALSPVLLSTAVLAVFVPALLFLAVIAIPVAIALALDAYRNLGHAITGDYLVTRYGVASRHTVAMHRPGIIGWTITSSPFQRRAGLITLNATTAANRGAYPIHDVSESAGLRLAAQAVPGLLDPFLRVENK